MKLSKIFVDHHHFIDSFVSILLMKRKRSELLQEKSIEPPKYIFDEKFRRVLPYYYEYSTFSKERWCGRTLIDVFSTDFKDKPSFYYESAIKNSLITVNGQSITSDYIVKQNDVISHLIHRHEPPVLNLSIQVIFEDEDVLAVNKPPSMPVLFVNFIMFLGSSFWSI